MLNGHECRALFKICSPLQAMVTPPIENDSSKTSWTKTHKQNTKKHDKQTNKRQARCTEVFSNPDLHLTIFIGGKCFYVFMFFVLMKQITMPEHQGVVGILAK